MCICQSICESPLPRKPFWVGGVELPSLGGFGAGRGVLTCFEMFRGWSYIETPRNLPELLFRGFHSKPEVLMCFEMF